MAATSPSRTLLTSLSTQSYARNSERSKYQDQFPRDQQHQHQHQHQQQLLHRRSSSNLLSSVSQRSPSDLGIPASAVPHDNENKGLGFLSAADLQHQRLQEAQYHYQQQQQQQQQQQSGDWLDRTMHKGQRAVSSPLHQHGPGQRQPQYRSSREFRNSIGSMSGNGLSSNGSSHGNNGSNGHAPLPVPEGRLGNGHVRPGTGFGPGPLAFEGARSPPGTKNTSHVPCKFYKQGACQAGKACPFLHSDGPVAETVPCKYFTKGNCKFGAKCALAHVLPNGRRVSRPNLALAGTNYHRMPPQNSLDSPTHNSLLTLQAHMDPHQQQYPVSPHDDLQYQQSLMHKRSYDMVPTINNTLASQPASNYGSPPADSRFPASPVQKGLSVLDAPLPASFDSQGISHMARYGPFAASLPSKFAFESPPSSLPSQNVIDSSALRNLHETAFSDDKTSNKLNGLGSSPPVVPEDYLARRFLRNERLSKSRMTSASAGASAPAGSDDWDGNFAFEEDLVPKSLDELLTPEEKMRRLAHGGNVTNQDEAASRSSRSMLGTPVEPGSKVGSPSASSPSRFAGSLFPRAQGKGEVAETPMSGASPFGHVGSPLRNSILSLTDNPPSRAPISSSSARTFNESTHTASPPRYGNTGMSMISQQLSGMRVGSLSRSSSEPNAEAPHPAVPRVSLGAGAAPGASGRSNAPSSTATTNGARERAEDEQGLFSMEEEEEEEEEGDNRHDGKSELVLNGHDAENGADQDEARRNVGKAGKKNERATGKRKEPQNGKRVPSGWMFGLGSSGKGPSPSASMPMGIDPRKSSAMGKAALGWD